MVDYKKIKTGFFRGLVSISALTGIALAVGYGLISLAAPAPVEGNYKGHRIEARNMGESQVLWIDGKTGGRLRAEDHKPIGNWNGLEDEVVLTGVSEADSLYRFVYPNVLSDAYEKTVGKIK